MSTRKLLINARFITMDPKLPEAGGLLLEGERIAAVFRPGERLPAADCEVVDLGGGTVLPGFTDCHAHLTLTGLTAAEPNLSGCRNREELAAALAGALRAWDGPGLFRAWNYDDVAFPASERPDRAWLDKIAPNRPVFLGRIGNAACLLNTAALEQLGVDPDVHGVVRGVDGRPNGQLWGEANHFVVETVTGSLTRDDRRRAAEAGARLALSRGVTCLHAIEGGYFGQMRGGPAATNFDAMELQELVHQLPLDVLTMDTAVRSLADLDRIAALGLRQVGGDIFMDGVLGAAYIPGAHRAALSEPYADGQGGNGHLLLSDEQVLGLMERAAQLDLQFSAHAVGDRSIGQFLRCWAQVVRNYPAAAGLRPRIEHGILPTPEQIRQAADLGVVFSMQPAFEMQSGGLSGRYMARLGPARIKQTHPLRALVDAGVVVAGGSDSPVQAIDPLQGVQAAVCHPFWENRLTLEEALGVFTTGAALAGFQDNRRGKLAPGAQADLAVLIADPRAVPPEQIASIRVAETWHAGNCVYEGSIADAHQR